jgi:uncharacterized membrane protein
VSDPRVGWNLPKPEYIPRPTAWPPAMALGITFFAWGLVTSPIVVAIGLVLLVISLAGWIGEIRHERRPG